MASIFSYAQQSWENVLSTLNSRLSGLTSQEVIQRRNEYGLNTIKEKKSIFFPILFRQIFGNPLLVILTLATIVSFLLGQTISSYYIFGLIIVSILLGLWNEYSAEKVVESLLKKISHNVTVIRDGQKQDVPIIDITLGDLIIIAPGSIIPADLRLIETQNLTIDESALTGESKATDKNSLIVSSQAKSLTYLKNIAFMGTTVSTGTGMGVVVGIGKQTEFGKIAKSTSFLKPVTEFQKGLSGFGQLILKVIFILTIVIFLVNALLGHNILESILFSLAIAVGLTPELLPVIVTISLSHGAGKLSKKHVITKQLAAIENLGNMDILCTDKTGTLTEGKITLVKSMNEKGEEDVEVTRLSLFANTAVVHHKIIGDPIDSAIWQYAQLHNYHTHSWEKITEVPFDFQKRAMFAIGKEDDTYHIIVKGAPDSIIHLCKHISEKEKLLQKVKALNSQGYRVVFVATKTVQKKSSYSWEDIHDLTFQGYLTFIDTPKITAKHAISRLHDLNVSIKVITGDNEITAQKICEEVGIPVTHFLTGENIDQLSDNGLKEKIIETSLFARVSPEQKLRIIQTLQSLGHTVGYMGDGINDIPSLHSADVGLSVDSAVDVAKSAASVVLLQKNLHVIADGIAEGRRTFNNTIKYILMATSSNFGNMFSAAGSSFFLPFLPMTPVQILLTNGLYDISQLSIPSDNVDNESLIKPRHWNINFIKNYMIFFGPISSVYDFLTFGVMLFFFHAKGPLFQTGWFIESMATEILVVFVIRTSKSPFFLSRPSKWLLITCLGIVGISLLLPFSPLAQPLGFMTPPPLYFGILIILVSTYLFLVEFLKKQFLKRYSL